MCLLVLVVFVSRVWIGLSEETPELELQVVVSHYVDPGNQTWTFCESSEHS